MGGATAYTVSAIDTFYLHGGFLKHYSLKSLLEDRLIFEVSEILKDPEKKEKKDILSKVKDLLPLVNTAITLINKSVNAINN
ncbi:hypothetical protein Dfri01_15130 [Dyadobacter frigoris]|nr:hypothetical protein Dfri01_15130 [Dyadobacter frigoris]